MHGVSTLFHRFMDAISTPRPVIPAEARVYIQHQSIYPPTMVSRFYLLEDLDPMHFQRVVDELADIDEIMRANSFAAGIRFHPKYLAVSWRLPDDEFEQICRQVEIEEDILMVLREILGWQQTPQVEHFSTDHEEARRQKLQASRRHGIIWFIT